MEAKKSLMTLVNERAQLLELIAEDGELSNEAMEKAFDFTTKGLATKLDNYHFFMADLEAQEELLKKQAELYSKAQKRAKAMREWLKENIKQAMTTLGTDLLEGETVRFKKSPAKASLQINEDELDQSYLMTVTSRVPDKERIRAAIEEGITVKGAQLIPSFTLRPTALVKKGVA